MASGVSRCAWDCPSLKCPPMPRAVFACAPAARPAVIQARIDLVELFNLMNVGNFTRLKRSGLRGARENAKHPAWTPYASQD